MSVIGKAVKAATEATGELAPGAATAARRPLTPAAEKAAAPPVGDVLEAVAAQARAAPPPPMLTVEELQRWVGVPDVVLRTLNRSGRVEVAAGEIESVSERAGALIIQFKHQDPELLRGKLQGTEVPHVHSRTVYVPADGSSGVLAIGRASESALAETRQQRLRLRGRAAEISEQLERGEYALPFKLDAELYSVSKTGQGLRASYEFPPEFADALKREQNALFSVILEKIAPRIERQQPDSASLDALFSAEAADGAEDAFTRLSERTAYPLSGGVRELHAGNSPAHAYLAPALKGAQEIIEFRSRHGIGQRFSGTEDALTTGLTTLKLHSASLARVVPEVWALRNPGVAADAAQLVTTYRNSRRLLDQMASSDIGLHALQALRRDPSALAWDPSFFKLVGEGDNLTLAFTDDFIRAFKEEHGAWVNTPLSSATGCPALTAGILSSYSRRLEPGLSQLYDQLLNGKRGSDPVEL